MISALALLLVLRRFYYVGRHVYMTSASELLLVFRHFYYVGRHVSVPYNIIPSGIYIVPSLVHYLSPVQASKCLYVCIRIRNDKKVNSLDMKGT